MTERTNASLLAEIGRLRKALAGLAQDNEELRSANAELGIEREAADALLGEAIDQLRADS